MTNLNKKLKSLTVGLLASLTVFSHTSILAETFIGIRPITSAQQATLNYDGSIADPHIEKPRTVNMQQVNVSDPGNNAAVLIRGRHGMEYSFGSGMFISPNVIITAAHVLSDDNGQLLPGELYTYSQGSNSAYQAGTYEPNGLTYAFNASNIHFYNQGAYKPSTPTDLIAIVVDTPMQLTYPGTEFNDLGDPNEHLTNIRTVGYPASADGTNLTLGALYQTGGALRSGHGHAGMMMSDGDSIEGVSGAGVLNDRNQVVGVHTSTFFMNDGTHPGSIRLTQEHMNWIKQLVEANKVQGWREYNGAKYYFKEDGHLLRNTTQTIDGEEYTFDSLGKATAKNETSRVVSRETSSSSSNTTPSSSSTKPSSTSSSSSSSSSSTSSSSSSTKPSKLVKPSVSEDKRFTNKARPAKTTNKKDNVTPIIVGTLLVSFLAGIVGTVMLHKTE